MSRIGELWLIAASLIVVCVFGANSAASFQEQIPLCEAPETIWNPDGLESYAEYNRLVCKGIAQLSRGEYAQAVEFLEEAFAIHFFEDINYLLYPRLALAYHLKGDEENAKKLLEETDLALRLHAGLLRCRHDDKEGFIIVRRDGTPVSSPHHDAVRNRMCSVFTEEDFFEPRTLVQFELKADLIKSYFEVRSKVLP